MIDIYVLADSGEPSVMRYVGQALNAKRRLMAHLQEALGGGRTPKCAWIRTVLDLGRSITQRVICAADVGRSDVVETALISALRAAGHPLTNRADGGSTPPAWNRGKSWSAEVRAKLAAARRGKTVPAAERSRISASVSAIEFFRRGFGGRDVPVSEIYGTVSSG